MSASFRYEARTGAGRLERGGVSATDQADALRILRGRDLTPVALRRASAVSASSLDAPSARDLASTLEQLLRAGLSLAQALRFAGEELPPRAAAAAQRMREAAEQGRAASEALAEFAGAEAQQLRGVIHAGETSGRLADALSTAAATFAQIATVRERLGAAMIYPAFVVFATLATLGCFLLVVVPTISQAFVGAEDRLPASTRSLLALSTWLQTQGPVALLGILVLGILAGSSAETRRVGRHVLDMIAASPFAMGIATRLEFASFSRLVALSLEAGVPSAAAFDGALLAVGNGQVRSNLSRAVATLRLGELPSQALARHAQAPRAFLRLVLVGEQTGRLSDALAQASTLLNNEARQRLERLGAIAGPIVTLALGGLVAGVVASLFLGLLAMSDLATA